MLKQISRMEPQIKQEYQFLFMKKIYDWNVRVFITVTNSQNKIQLVCSIHTNIHQLKILVVKKLNLSILDTRVDVYFLNDRPMKSTSTLLQNQITNNCCLTATIVRTKISTQLPIRNQKSNQADEKQKKRVQNVGLSIKSSCTYENCVNYNQKIEINYGYGTFPILQLVTFAKCQFCPYKSQCLRPNMMSHQIIIEQCYYQLKGISLNSCGIPIKNETKVVKCIGKREIHEIIASKEWKTNMQLIVKAL